MGDQPPTKDLSGLEADLKKQIREILLDFNECLTMLEKAVELASEQVDHIRLKQIAKTLGGSSSYSLSDFFVDLLIATATSPLATIVLRIVATGIVRRGLKAKDALLVKGKDGVYEVASKFDVSDVTEMKIMKEKLHKKFDTSDVPEILKPGNKNYDLWRVDADMIFEPVSDATREAARKHVQESRKPRFTQDTSPKVLFRDAVYSFTHRQRTTDIKIWDKQVNKIDKHEFSEDQLKTFLELWKLPKITSSEDMDNLRRKFAKNFEALMWVLLCGGYKNMVTVSDPSKEVIVSVPGKGYYRAKGDRWNIDPELVVYWVNNLIHPFGDGKQTFRDKMLKDLGLPSFRTKEGTPVPYDPEQELDQVLMKQFTDSAQVDLKQYFKQLSENTERILADPQRILIKAR